MECPVDDLYARFGNQQLVTAIVPLTGASLESVKQQWVEAGQAGADLVEWRLDLLEGISDDSELQARIAGLAVWARNAGLPPVLATYRTAFEGGALATTDAQYVALVQESATWADAVDVELVRHGAPQLILDLRKELPTVASFHNFDDHVDPEFLQTTLSVMAESGASVAKVAQNVGEPAGLGKILEVQDWAAKELPIPAVVIGMGPKAVASRLGDSALISAFTFATLGEKPGEQSAPGQPTLAQLRQSLAE